MRMCYTIARHLQLAMSLINEGKKSKSSTGIGLL